MRQREQVLHRLDVLPLRSRGMDPEPPLQFRDQPKGVCLPVHLQIPAKVDSTAEVSARPKCDLFEKRINGGG